MSRQGLYWTPRERPHHERPHHKPTAPSILFLADSRGRNLDTDLCDLLGNTFTLRYYPGATIMDTIRKSQCLLMENSWSQIYCLAGICNLTVKDHVSRVVSIRNHDIGHLVNDYCHNLHEAHSEILRQCPQADYPKCIFCPVTGLNFSAYNKRSLHSDDSQNQMILNEAVSQINTEITKFNNLHKYFTPWTSRAVHRRHRKSFTNNYEKLAIDGCHLSPSVRLHWADSLYEAVVKNT